MDVYNLNSAPLKVNGKFHSFFWIMLLGWIQVGLSPVRCSRIEADDVHARLDQRPQST